LAADRSPGGCCQWRLAVPPATLQRPESTTGQPGVSAGASGAPWLRYQYHECGGMAALEAVKALIPKKSWSSVQTPPGRAASRRSIAASSWSIATGLVRQTSTSSAYSPPTGGAALIRTTG